MKPEAHVFPGEDALLAALVSGLVPAAAQRRPVAWWRGEDGSVGVVPAEPLSKAAAKRLSAAGVRVAQPRSRIRRAASWAEVVRPRPAAGDGPYGRVLFRTDGGSNLLELAAELLRLGCGSQGFRMGKGLALLSAEHPPYFSVISARDRARGLRAYVPMRPGEESLWIEIGWTHPLADRLLPGDGEIVLVDGDGEWLRVEDGPWTDLYQVAKIEAPGPAVALEALEDPPRFEVRLRLGRSGRTEPATLLVVRRDALPALDRLVETSTDEVLERLLFAVARTPTRPVAILKVRRGRGAPPELDLAGEGYVPLLGLPNLFVPRDAVLEPPLRRDRIRAILDPGADRIGWLAPALEGGFRLETIREDSFRPLGEWVDHVVDSAAEALEGWVRSALFDFEPYEVDPEERRAPVEDPESRPERPGRRRRPEPAPEVPAQDEVEEEVLAEEEVPVVRRRGRRRRPAASEEAADVETEEALVRLEREFLALDSPADDPGRRRLWGEMALVLVRLGRRRDATLSWARVVWDGTPDEALRAAREWAAPAADVFGLAGEIVLGDLEGRAPEDPHRFQIRLDAEEDALDLRSRWLARLALARGVGGDRLGLARARDRILALAASGLSLERDVPAFLRFLGAPAGFEPAAARRLAGVLEALRERIRGAPRSRSVLEAPPEKTFAYVDLVFAHAFARLGRSDWARELSGPAAAALDRDDPVSGFLVRAFEARIVQALEGLAPETPLPEELATELEGLDRLARYKVDRFRDVSRILEPRERLDPFQGFFRTGAEGAGRGPLDPRSALDRAEDASLAAEERARLARSAAGGLSRLPEADALPLLERAMSLAEEFPPAARALLLETAFAAAGFFGRTEEAAAITRRLEAVVAELEAGAAVEVVQGSWGWIRTLRRLGLADQAAELLAGLAEAVKGVGAMDGLVVRVSLAGGLAYLGERERSRECLAEADLVLGGKDLGVPDRIRLVRASASAWAEFGPDEAVDRIRGLAGGFGSVTDSFNTNSHFCLSVIAFAEALVLGVVGEDLALGPAGRRWLDEDEASFRRRLHRDMERHA